MNVAAKPSSKSVKPAPGPKGPSVVASPAGTELRLRQRYQEKILPALIQRFAYTNALQVPRLVKVVANIGIGESIANPKALDAATADLKKITGQQPVIMKSRKAIVCVNCGEIYERVRDKV